MAIGSDAESRRREVLERLFTPDGKPRVGLDESRALGSADVAALFRMTERAIRLLAAKGKLPHMRTLGGGRLLYPADEIAVLYAQVSSNGRPRRSSWQGEGVNTGNLAT